MMYDPRSFFVAVTGSLGALGIVLLVMRFWQPELPPEIGGFLFPLLGIATALAGKSGALWLASRR